MEVVFEVAARVRERKQTEVTARHAEATDPVGGIRTGVPSSVRSSIVATHRRSFRWACRE